MDFVVLVQSAPVDCKWQLILFMMQFWHIMYCAFILKVTAFLASFPVIADTKLPAPS